MGGVRRGGFSGYLFTAERESGDDHEIRVLRPGIELEKELVRGR